MKKTFKLIVVLLTILIAAIFLTSLKKTIGGINGLFTSCSLTCTMHLESNNTSEPSTLNVDVKGFNFFNGGKFYGHITIGENYIESKDSKYLIRTTKEANQYTISAIESPAVADNGIDLIAGTNIFIVVDDNKVVLNINDNAEISRYISENLK